MSFTLEKFGATYAGGVTLPTTLHPLSEGPGPINSRMVELPGYGAWDALGTGTAKSEVQQVTHRGRVTAASAALLQTALENLYALRGQRNLLWKSSDGGTTNRWRYARVLDVRAELGLRNATPWATVEMDFELAAGLWNGAAHAETTVIDAASHAVATTNAGNAIVRDAIITVTAKVATITAVSFYIAGVLHWHYAGTIGIDKALVVNCGTKSVLNDGADAFADFALQADHPSADWNPLAVGLNTITVETTSADHTAHEVNLAYNDGWL